MTRFQSSYKIPFVTPGMKIGLLGGSFNPPHEGHRHISLVALKRFGLDRIWWIVTPGNPLKSHDELLPLERRLELCRTMTCHPRIDSTAFEATRPSSYTADTLSYLSSRNPEVHFLWLMGADNLRSFHHWKDWRAIFHFMPIAVIDRPGYRYHAVASHAAQSFRSYYIPENKAPSLIFRQTPAWTFLTAHLVALSSTEIRQKENILNHKKAD